MHSYVYECIHNNSHYHLARHRVKHLHVACERGARGSWGGNGVVVVRRDVETRQWPRPRDGTDGVVCRWHKSSSRCDNINYLIWFLFCTARGPSPFEQNFRCRNHTKSYLSKLFLFIQCMYSYFHGLFKGRLQQQNVNMYKCDQKPCSSLLIIKASNRNTICDQFFASYFQTHFLPIPILP